MKSINYGNCLCNKPVYEYPPLLSSFHIKLIGEHIKNIKEHLLVLRFLEKQQTIHLYAEILDDHKFYAIVFYLKI